MSIAIITGASSGLGKCYVDAVIKLYPEIYEIWLIARRKERLQEVSNLYSGKQFVIFPMDMSNLENYNLLEERLKYSEAKIKVLVNDAGVARSGSFKEMSISDMMSIIDLNCKGATVITRICLPYMESGGTILEVSSTSAFVPNTNLVVYSASKSYLSMLSLGLREELKSQKINVCAVCPGLMLTEMNQKDGKQHLTKGQRRLPIIDPNVAAIKSLKAAKKGYAVYTTGTFYKFYRLLTKILPQTFLVKFVGLE